MNPFLIIVEEKSWKLIRVLLGHRGWVHSITLDIDGELLASGSADGTIRLWNMESGRRLVTFSGHQCSVLDVKAYKNSPYLFSGGEDKKIICWDMEVGHMTRTYCGHERAVYSISPVPDQQGLLSGGRDSVAKIWDVRTRKEVGTLMGHKAAIFQVAYVPVENLAVTGGGDSKVLIWDLRTRRCIRELSYHEKAVRSLSIHPESRILVSGSADTIMEYDIREDRPLFDMKWSCGEIVSSILFVGNEEVFVGGRGGTGVFYKLETGKLCGYITDMELPGSLASERSILSSSYRKKGAKLITGHMDKSIKIWNKGS